MLFTVNCQSYFNVLWLSKFIKKNICFVDYMLETSDVDFGYQISDAQEKWRFS